MTGILADVNIEGHIQVLLRLLQQDHRSEFWVHLNLRTPTFGELGLPAETADLVVWQTCQREDLILLITASGPITGPATRCLWCWTGRRSQSSPLRICCRNSRAGLQDRATAARVLLLFGVEKGPAQIDEVEIDLLQNCPAEVGETQVGLADLLRRLEVLLVVVVGVEAGLAPLAGDGTADPPAPR